MLDNFQSTSVSICSCDLTAAVNRLDSLRVDIVDLKKGTFEQAALAVSQDKDSRNNNGVMLNEETRSTLFEMSQLPAEVAKVVDTLAVGQVSRPFIMMNRATNRQQVALVKLSKRIEGHKADLGDDYQTLKEMYENHKKSEIIDNWVKEKQRSTYVYIEEGWRNCDFKYDWLKKNETQGK